MSKRIAMVNGKGGVGKTTCSLLICAALQDNGMNVVIQDRDETQQGSEKKVGFMGLKTGTEADFVIIDTPPHIKDPGFLEPIVEADLVVLITSPSPGDMDTTAATAEIIKQRRQGKTVILLNQVKPGTTLTRDVDEMVALLPFPRLKNMLSDRQNFQKVQLRGWSFLTKAEQNEVLKVALEIMAE